MSVDEMKEEIIIKTRQYSRRQIQWFRKEKMDATIDISQLDRVLIMETILNLFPGYNDYQMNHNSLKNSLCL